MIKLLGKLLQSTEYSMLSNNFMLSNAAAIALRILMLNFTVALLCFIQLCTSAQLE